jgi:hypothetical protein
MVILCDTCSILMLLRIAAEMFADNRFECRTIREVHEEILRTTKFKTRYPWTRDFRDRIRPRPLTDAQKESEARNFAAVKALVDNVTLNERTGRPFDLSYIDIKVISHCVTLESHLSSGDDCLVDFLKQQYPGSFKGSVPPLELINRWLAAQLVVWDDAKQTVLVEWATMNEHPQPRPAAARFRELTGRAYPGP